MLLSLAMNMTKHSHHPYLMAILSPILETNVYWLVEEKDETTCKKAELRLGYRACQSIGICIITFPPV